MAANVRMFILCFVLGTLVMGSPLSGDLEESVYGDLRNSSKHNFAKTMFDDLQTFGKSSRRGNDILNAYKTGRLQFTFQEINFIISDIYRDMYAMGREQSK